MKRNVLQHTELHTTVLLGFFVQKLGLYRITDERKEWQKDCFWISLHYFVYSVFNTEYINKYKYKYILYIAVFKTGRETVTGQAQHITPVCLQLIKKGSRRLWGQFGESFIICCGMPWILMYSALEASLELPTEQSMAFTEELKAAIRREQILQLAIWGL